MDEAAGDCDVGDIGDPELVEPIKSHVLSQFCEDWLIMVAAVSLTLLAGRSW